MFPRRRIVPRQAASRRALLVALLGAPLLARADASVLAAALRDGGAVVAFRHAFAPGTFDPPQFRLGDCATQRNLNDEGRAQARRIGAWFRDRGLEPAAVRSSPWCRCMDTARLAFGRAEAWPALGSPRGSPAPAHAGHLDALRQALQVTTGRPGRLEVWVTHMFVLADLARQNTASAEGLVLQSGAGGMPDVLARIRIA